MIGRVHVYMSILLHNSRVPLKTTLLYGFRKIATRLRNANNKLIV